MNRDGGPGVSRASPAREGFPSEKKLNLREKLRNLDSVLIVNGEASTLDELATLGKGGTYFWTMARPSVRRFSVRRFVYPGPLSWSFTALV